MAIGVVLTLLLGSLFARGENHRVVPLPLGIDANAIEALQPNALVRDRHAVYVVAKFLALGLKQGPPLRGNIAALFGVVRAHQLARDLDVVRFLYGLDDLLRCVILRQRYNDEGFYFTLELRFCKRR